MRCSNCKTFQIIAYPWIKHCPGCGIAFECDTNKGFPILVASNGNLVTVDNYKETMPNLLK
jgi:hypothetical protein